MSKVRFGVAVSLDGFMAGPQQSRDNPLGVGGMRLHDWVFPLEAFRRMHGETGGVTNASSQVVEESMAHAGAFLMGANMFGGHDPDWTGWWGPNPPYHAPVFVLTHHPRAPLVMEGGTTFNFVTDGLGAAMARAREAAGDDDVVVAGGASVIRQCLDAGLVNEINISLAPVFLGSGERLFGDLRPDLKIEQVRVIEAPGVTHLRYRVL